MVSDQTALRVLHTDLATSWNDLFSSTTSEQFNVECKLWVNSVLAYQQTLPYSFCVLQIMQPKLQVLSEFYIYWKNISRNSWIRRKQCCIRNLAVQDEWEL